MAKKNTGAAGYVCVQCGKDANGGPVHRLTHHTLPPLSPGDAVEQLVDEWHEGAGGDIELHEYLGWTEGEYDHWVETSKLPPHA